MGKGVMVLLGILAAVVMLGLVVVGNIVVFRNEVVTFSKTIEAQVSDMKAKYNEYFLKVREAAQVPKEQFTQLEKIYDKIVSGRTENKALFKFIGEQNPNLNQETYVEIQRIIQAGRAEIYGIQKTHIDTVREYNTFITVFPNNFINHMFFNYEIKEPTLPIVSNVQEIFETKQDKEIKIF